MSDEPTQSRVLLVDDDPAILRILAKSLEVDGYDVRQTTDALEALDLIAADPPDFLITDWDMPSLTGLELCRRVRQLDLPHYVYVLFVTGKTGQAEIIAGLEGGADDFVTKPVNRGELLARLRAGSRVLDVERRLSRQAHTDLLTGIATRRSFIDVCRREFERGRRYNTPYSCVMLDVDYFKRVNDEFGHPSGDIVLQEVARTLMEHCRASDFPCRYGGEEFAVILPETRECDAMIWANRVREAIASREMVFDGRHVRLTASFGVAQRSDDVQSPDQLINLADQALLVAKKAGRNRVVCYSRLQSTQPREPAAVDHVDMFQSTVARDIMSSPVASLRDIATVAQAAEYFLRYRISSTPVIDEAGRAIGILSEQDCIAAMTSADGWERPIYDVMSRNVVSFEETTPVREIHRFFCNVSLRRVIIVRDGEPTGVISRSTMMRWLQHWAAVRNGWRTASDAPIDEELNARAQAERGVRSILDRAQTMKGRLDEEPGNATPILIEGATQIQELCNDLLGFTRGPSSPQSLRELVTNFL